MSKSRKKGYELMREIALHEIVGVIRKAGALSAPEIMTATGRSRGNVDGYLRELEEGGHVLRGLPPVAQRKGATFVYTAPEGQVRELPARGALSTPLGTSVVHTDYTAIERRVAAHLAEQPPSVLTVERGSKSGPIPAHPSAYQQQIQGTPFPAESEFTGLNLDAMNRSASVPRDPRGFVLTEQIGRTSCETTNMKPDPDDAALLRGVLLGDLTARPHPADKLPEPFRSNDKIRDAEAKRERRDDRRWRAGFTHLTKGGDFELRDDGGGKTSIRRVTVDGVEGTRYSAPVQLPTSDALAMFVEASKPAPGPLNQPEGEVWITPAPSTAPVPKPRPRKTGADDLGHFGQGGGSESADTDEQADEGGES